MYLVTSQEMKEIDKKTITDYNVPPEILMENAGRSVVDAVLNEFGSVFFKKICVFCGGGNNGGDGFVIARHLLNEGAIVKVFFTGEKEKLSKEARMNYEIIRKYGIDVKILKSEKDIEKHQYEILDSDIYIDALIGTGLNKNIEGFLSKLIVFLNTTGKYIVSVDIPSGVNADNGNIMGVAIYANLTVTFGLPKVGLTIYPGIEYVGKLIVADINFPQELLNMSRRNVLITKDIVSKMLPYRHPNANKGNFGPILVIGGSPGLDGAVTLTAKSALRTGAGIVNLCVPESLYNSIKSRSDEVIVTKLKETDDGFISEKNFDTILKLAEKAKVIILGPGIGRKEETQFLIRNIVLKLDKPMVIDADGINAISIDKKCLKNLKKDVILTPHIGEMARLVNKPIEYVIKNKISVLEEFVDEYNVNIVLKDGRSITMDINKNIYINTTGNSGMATPGSGDVLTGIIGAFMAHNLVSVQSGIIGNYIHGMAGDMLLDIISEEGIIASDLIEYIPRAIKKLKE